MSRIVAIGLAAIVSADARTQDWGPLRGATEFAPSNSEIARVIASSSNIPADARLESAVFVRANVAAGAQPSDTRRTNSYTFSWPIEQGFGAVQYLRQAECRQTDPLGPICVEHMGPYVEWHGSTVSIDGRFSEPETAELLQEFDRLFPDAEGLLFAWQISVSEPNRRFSERRSYRFLVRMQEGNHDYTVRKRCRENAGCMWNVKSKGRIDLSP